MRARQYNPYLGRFTSRDPVRGQFREPLTLHVYLYCINDPVNKIDPEGKVFTLMGLVVGVTISDAFKHTEHAYLAAAVGTIVPTAIGLVMDYYLFWPYIEKIMESKNVNVWKDYYERKLKEYGPENYSPVNLIFDWFVGDL